MRGRSFPCGRNGHRVVSVVRRVRKASNWMSLFAVGTLVGQLPPRTGVLSSPEDIRLRV
jgi:hypothetical protein